MPYAQRDHARAYWIIKVIRIMNVDQNVSSIMIVREIKPVSVTNAKILAQARAAKMRNVMSLTIFPCAVVYLVIVETLLSLAELLNVCVYYSINTASER